MNNTEARMQIASAPVASELCLRPRAQLADLDARPRARPRRANMSAAAGSRTLSPPLVSLSLVPSLSRFSFTCTDYSLSLCSLTAVHTFLYLVAPHSAALTHHYGGRAN